MSEVSEIKAQFELLQEKYEKYLPKVDPALIHDLLLRQRENPLETPIYMLEVFTKSGIDPEEAREYIMSKTGAAPAIFDNGTHYATNQRLTLEMLKEISDSDDVLEVTGEYTARIGGYPVSHEHGHRTHGGKGPATVSVQQVPTEVPIERRAATASVMQKDKVRIRTKGYMLAVYTAAGIIGALAIAGFIISGGLLPNAKVPSVPVVSEPGVIHGYVAGPKGLPAVGATLVVAEQGGSGFTKSAFISVDGQYYVDVPAGNYIVMVAYPDGTDKKVDNLIIERGSSHELNFSY